MNIRKEHDYSTLYAGIDQVIRAELSQMELYCELGKLICARPEKGAAVAAAAYLTEECPGQAGFSARNVRRMRDFYRMYENVPELLAQAMRLGWTQNVVIREADLTLEERAWYLQAAEQFGWSKLTLQKKIAEAAHLTEALDSAPKTCYNGRKVFHPNRFPCSGDFKVRPQYGKRRSGVRLCDTEHDKSVVIAFTENNIDGPLLLQLDKQYGQEKHYVFSAPVRKRYMGREPPIVCTQNAQNGEAATVLHES